MLLSKYKKDNRYTTQDLADRFGVSHRTMHTYLHSGDVHIRGREGHKQLYRKRGIDVIAEEGELRYWRRKNNDDSI